MSTVDTGLQAHTTGRAAKLASEHSAAHPLQLYGGWFCPFVQRAWIVLHELQIPHQYKEVNPYKKEPDFLALNPRGLVPTLAVPVHRDSGRAQKPLYESTVICAYLDEAYSDRSPQDEHSHGHGRSLLPEDAYERARSRLWIDHIGTRIIPQFYRFIQHQPDKDYSIEDVRAEFLAHLKTFVREADPVGPFFLGSRFSMVDIMLAPWACRLFLIDHYKPGGVGIPGPDTDTGSNSVSKSDSNIGARGNGGNGGGGGTDDDKPVWQRWRKWFDAVMARPSVLNTLSDAEDYVQAYKRYAEDTTNSQVGHATRKGRGLP